MPTTPVVVVEDDDKYLAAVSKALAAQPGYDIQAIYRSADECLHARVMPDSVWLIDLGLPGRFSGLDLIVPVVDHGARVLVTTVYEDQARVLTAIQNGAHGYHVKGDGSLIESLNKIIEGLAPLSPRIASHLLRRLRNAGQPGNVTPLRSELSPRETQTLQALAHGYSYREIATQHGVSFHTVGDHVKSIYKKLRVNTRTGAINSALKQGLLTLDEV